MLKQESKNNSSVVLISTQASVESGAISILAICEVGIAVVLYWLIAYVSHTQIQLWGSIFIAPLLLLRSDSSKSLGIRWFEKYVDDGFDLTPEEAIWSPWLALSAMTSIVVTGGVTNLLAGVLDISQLSVFSILKSILVAYLAVQAGVATSMAIAANEIAAIIRWRPASIVIILSAVSATVAGVYLSSSGLVPGLVVVGTTVALATVGGYATSRMRNEKEWIVCSESGESRGVSAARVFLARAPEVFVIFAVAIGLAGWARSVMIRLLATARHPIAGLKALPENWRQTLFVVDIRHAPEVIPGYNKPDPLKSTYLLKEIRGTRNFYALFVYISLYIIMFIPALFYRLTIKSTFWFYIPLVYITKPRRYDNKPELLSDLLWISPLEWWRRLLAVLTLMALIFNQTARAALEGRVPSEVISPLEYMFVFDIHTIRFWQWFNIGSAFLTIAIFFFADTFRIFVKHSSEDALLRKLVSGRTITLEYAMRGRNLSTFCFLLGAFFHALIWKVPGIWSSPCPFSGS